MRPISFLNTMREIMRQAFLDYHRILRRKKIYDDSKLEAVKISRDS